MGQLGRDGAVSLGKPAVSFNGKHVWRDDFHWSLLSR